MLESSLLEATRLETQLKILGLASHHRARAPSFQASALGPAIHILSEKYPILPLISHARWMKAMGSGDVEDMNSLLRKLDPDGEEVDDRGICIKLAQRNYQLSPNPAKFTSLTTASLFTVDSTTSTESVSSYFDFQPLMVESLPYSAFPPGMSYFAKDQEPGIIPCVVHANYASGQMKENLLRKEKLWALSNDQTFCEF